MMTAVWKKDLNTAPKDKRLLIESDAWECGAVVQWHAWGPDDHVEPEDGKGYWRYCDSLLSDVCGAVMPPDTAECWWIEYPVRKVS